MTDMQRLATFADSLEGCTFRLDTHGTGDIVIVPPEGVKLGTNIARRLMATDAMLTALRNAEDFILGFEDDDTQAGVPELLRSIGDAIAKAEGRS